MSKNINDQKLSSEYRVYVPKALQLLTKILVISTLFILVLLVVTPWVQTSRGYGQLIAYNPNDRVQDINSPVPGRIQKWYVRDGSALKKGDPIVEIVDNDPNFIERLKVERDAVLKRYEAAKAASETALINYERQEQLYKEGLSSRMKFEKSKIEYKKLLSSEATAAANLASAEVRFSRQQTQLVEAPRDGVVLRVMSGSGSSFVKEGDVLARFVPKAKEQAVEIYVPGNDLPLIYPGRNVRLQFEGWPAVQFSGWPSVAIGTFGGVVSNVDPSANKDGSFRVIVVPGKDDVWPSSQFLRQGTRVYGWILLNTVKLGYELWRQFNSFPPSLKAPPDGIEALKKSYEKSVDKQNKQMMIKELYKNE